MTLEGVTRQEVRLPMRDGVSLAMDVYLPEGNGPFPVLLSRTPYSKRRTGADEQAKRAMRIGFAVAIQDTRGRYASEGSFRSMQDDGPDGVDTLAWLGQQRWCNGRIGMYGVSYLGATQMMLAPLHPPHLHAAFSEQPSSDEFTDRTFHAGALTLANVEGWAVNSSGEQYNQRLAEPLRQRAEEELRQYRELGPKALEILPLENVPWLRLIPGIWQEVLDHVADPSYFSANDIRSKLDQINIPIYHLGGWFDPFLRNTIDHYKGASRVNSHQRLILGPWTHGGMRDSPFPDGAFDDFGYALAWHDHWLRDRPLISAQQHPVIIYVLGANRWRAEPSWPLPGTSVTTYYLQSGRRLGLQRSESFDTYVYDPHRPLPSPPMGLSHLTGLLQRDDVLVYATPPLEHALEVTGEVSATLFASSSAEDTDWMLRLVDIAPDGEASHIVDGVMRARYRHSRTRPTPLTPEVVERYDINLWATSLVFDRGHRIGLVICSSNFPKYDRHPNRFAELGKITEADFVAASQKVYHSAEYPSAVHLPVVRSAEHQNWIGNPMPLG